MTTALAFEAASAQYRERLLWRGLSFELAPQECVAVLGKSGAGKTTLARVVLGRHELTSGSVRVFDEAPRRGNPHVGYVPQHDPFDYDTNMRGRDLVTLGLTGPKFGIPWPNASVAARVDEMLDAVDATAYADRPIGRLSGGEQQRLRLAQALVHNPGLVICDEPLSSLDLNNQSAIVSLLDRFRKEHEATLLVITHDVGPLMPMLDRVVVIARGEAHVGAPHDLIRDDVLSDLYETPIRVVELDGSTMIVGVPG